MRDVPAFEWPAAGQFLGRDAELSRLEDWWRSGERAPVCLYGRRRVGKSWLFRRFAHGKPAVVLVARGTATGVQMDDFADRLEAPLGVRPALGGLDDLFRTLFRAARDRPLLAVIDEFPYLLPTTEPDVRRALAGVAAVMEEERDASQLRLILCGSLVGQMESLLAERSPLHGRLQPLKLDPVPFEQARLFLPGLSTLEQFERFAIGGGMPLYLRALADRRPLSEVVCERMLDRTASLWDEGRTIVEQEMREPKVYFGVLQALASGDKTTGEVASVLRSDAQRASKYLSALVDMRLVERKLPFGAEPTSRAGHWHLRDPFLRFWFRFVFPHQDDLENGLPAQSLYAQAVAPALSDHVAAPFEDLARGWVRSHLPVTAVGSWWGPALHALRRQGAGRASEEIDIVGQAHGHVRYIGEARWRTSAMDTGYLSDIERYKLPALRQSGLTIAADPTIVLLSRGGYSDGLKAAAQARDDLILVPLENVLEGLPDEEATHE